MAHFISQMLIALGLFSGATACTGNGSSGDLIAYYERSGGIIGESLTVSIYRTGDAVVNHRGVVSRTRQSDTVLEVMRTVFANAPDSQLLDSPPKAKPCCDQITAIARYGDNYLDLTEVDDESASDLYRAVKNMAATSREEEGIPGGEKKSEGETPETEPSAAENPEVLLDTAEVRREV